MPGIILLVGVKPGVALLDVAAPSVKKRFITKTDDSLLS